MIALVALLVFASAAAIDYAAVCYQAAVAQLTPHRAARWSVGQFAASAVGLVAAIQVGWWLLGPEGAGYYCGTWLAVRRLQRDHSMA